MQKIAFTVCLSLCLSSLFAQRVIDVLHYKYEIKLSDLSDSIQGKATIKVKFLEETASFALDIKSQNSNDKKGISPVLISEDSIYTGAVLHKDDKFIITPNRKIKKETVGK